MFRNVVSLYSQILNFSGMLTKNLTLALLVQWIAREVLTYARRENLSMTKKKILVTG